jgi:hypothetical protein
VCCVSASRHSVHLAGFIADVARQWFTSVPPAVYSNMVGNEPRPKPIEMIALVGCIRERRTH